MVTNDPTVICLPNPSGGLICIDPSTGNIVEGPSGGGGGGGNNNNNNGGNDNNDNNNNGQLPKPPDPPQPPPPPPNPLIGSVLVTELGGNVIRFQVNNPLVKFASWTFGDGTSFAPTLASRGLDIKHKYASTGDYTAHVAGAGNALDVPVHVAGISPVVDFTYTLAGLTIYITDISTPDGIRQWNFGHGFEPLYNDKRYIEYTVPSAGTWVIQLRIGNYTATHSVVVAPPIELSWEEAGSVTGFYIERSPNGVAWTQVEDTGSDVHTANVSITQGVDIYAHNEFRVKAYNGSGSSDPSNVVTTDYARP